MKKFHILAFLLTGTILFGAGCNLPQAGDDVDSDVPVEENTQDNGAGETALFMNTEFGFSVEIPKGYSATQSERYFYVSKDSVAENWMVSPEFTIRIQEGDDLGSLNPEAVKSEENVEVNGVTGNKIMEDSCPVYKFKLKKDVAEFRLWECLESPIYEQAVQSFKRL
ncbi:MAG: hypothetical protein NUV81_02275 [bacterium]|nr:hypothetical protein [bacterium]